MNKKSNLGRMMMEMLGVLALIGLLTLGFIFYQKALLADRVNRLMEDARLAGLVVLDGVYKKLTVNEELSLKGQFEQQTPYNFSAYLEGEELKTFVVLADGVPYDVCREVQDRHPQWAEEIIANKLQNQCLAEMDNIIGFFYNEELTNIKDSCTKNSDCGECGKCENNRCSYGFKNQSGTCFSCNNSNKAIYDVDKAECNKCKNRMWGNTYNGRCVKHLPDEGGNWWGGIPKDECEKFPNQYSTLDNHCFYCKGTFDPSTGVCSTSVCKTGVGQGKIYGLDENACTQCGARYRIRTMENGKVGFCQFD